MRKRELLEVDDKVKSYLMKSLGFDSLGRMALYLGSMSKMCAYDTIYRTDVDDYLDELTDTYGEYGVKLNYFGVWATPEVCDAYEQE